MQNIRALRVLVASTLLLALPNAATLATNAPPSPEHRPPGAPHLSVSVQPKALAFHWARVNGASHYQLMSNPDGHSGYARIGGVLPAGSTKTIVPVSAHLLDWDDATYILSACNSRGCTNSNVVGVAGLINKAVEVIPAPDEGTTPTGDQIVRKFSAGLAISGDGKTLAVGDYHYFARVGDDFVQFAGAVFVYRRSGGNWVLDAKLQQAHPMLGDQFGTALSLSADGRTLAIGEDQAGSPRMGTANVYTRAKGGWVLSAQLSPTTTITPASGGALFGTALDVSADGDFLAVGAPFEHIAGATGAIERAGAVYIYRRVASTGEWQLRDKLTTSSPEKDDRFGAQITLSKKGQWLIALAGEQNNATEELDGGFGDRINTLHAFVGDGANWQEQTQIEAPADSTFFGGSAYTSVQIVENRALEIDRAGKTLAVGVAQRVDAPLVPSEVRIYTREGNAWSLAQRIAPPPTLVSFGRVLALSADGRVLAARALDPALDPARPTVAVFERSGGTFSEQAVLTSPAPPPFNDTFGRSLALSRTGKSLAVGAADAGVGAVFIY